jgi:ubiquinone/menaquinone biosynthesis C-methylase UbiE
MSQHEQWQVSGNAPEAYERYLVPTLFTLWATDLIGRLPLHAGEHVLDVACGTGSVARLAAHRVSPGGTVTGLDLNPGMLAVARSLPHAPDVRMDWREGSAMALPSANALFNVVLCQQGLQFFPDRVAALREMHRVLVPGGRLGLSVWRPLQHNPYMAALGNALERHVSAEVAASSRTVCALGDAETLRSLLLQVGFREVCISIATLVMRFVSVEAFVPGQFVATPYARAVAALDAPARTALLEDVRMALRSYTGDTGVAVPTEAHVATAYTYAEGGAEGSSG